MRWLLTLTVLCACSKKPPAPVILRVTPAPSTELTKAQALADPEGYSISISLDGKLTVDATTDAGRFYAKQTLEQLERKGGQLELNDAPRYRWRALHLDVSRHFFPAKDVERILDLMARYKLNVFHWHLTDDHGWRLPVKKHPELTAGQPAYTRAEIEHVVAFAKERFITVVPEIDMPGHMLGLLHSHPELSCRGKPLPLATEPGIYEDVLCAGNPATYELINDVLDETAALFPGPYMHLGGDEVPTTRWDECPRCSALGLHPQKYFLAQVTAKLRELGKRPVGWDEVLEFDPPGDLVVMVWRGDTVHPGRDTVLVPYKLTYLDKTQNPYDDGANTVEKIAAWEPDSTALGIEAALWTEFVPDLRTAEARLFPRLLAVADVAWSSTTARKANPLAPRITKARHALDVSFYVAPPLGLEPRAAFIDGGTVTLSGEGTLEYALGDGPMTRYERPIAVTETTRISARASLGDQSSPTVHGRVVVEPPLPPVDAKASGPGVRYQLVEGPFIKLPDFDTLRGRFDVSPTLIPAGVPKEDWALRADGLFDAPTTKVYRFTLTSDDGSRLIIDGRDVIDNDGLHGPRPRRGEIALEKGLHRVRVEFFQHQGGYALELDPGALSVEAR